ncbi:MAG: hypothetical protein BMS9Abin23_0730 [Thermodesulfobacteriota bacterium]|nr:MAG: hypothetical protein BMS9Abin23_0730 [Thermodesulfobacteriota bacterium]
MFTVDRPQGSETGLEYIYVETPDGRKKMYPEEEAREMWSQGLIPDKALCWKEDSGGWRPAREFFTADNGQDSAETPLEPDARSRMYSFTKDPEFLTRLLRTMLWIFMVVVFLNLLSDLAQMNLFSSGSFTSARAEANNTRQAVLGILYTFTYLITAVTFLRWIYLASINCRGFNPDAMRFTPGWSVGYYFIPVLNLFRPYQTMKEVWLVSMDPRRGKDQSAGALLVWWWALWLISGLFGQASFRMTLAAKTPEALGTATSVSIVSDIALIALSIAAIKLVNTIFRMQEELVQRGD